MKVSLCNICLENNENLFNINETDDDKETYYSKLNNLVPELVN